MIPFYRGSGMLAAGAKGSASRSRPQTKRAWKQSWPIARKSASGGLRSSRPPPRFVAPPRCWRRAVQALCLALRKRFAAEEAAGLLHDNTRRRRHAAAANRDRGASGLSQRAATPGETTRWAGRDDGASRRGQRERGAGDLEGARSHAAPGADLSSCRAIRSSRQAAGRADQASRSRRQGRHRWTEGAVSPILRT